MARGNSCAFTRKQLEGEKGVFSNEFSLLPRCMDMDVYLCHKTEPLGGRKKIQPPLRNIKLKNGEQTPSTGGSLQKHPSRLFHPALPPNKTGASKC